MLRDSLRMSAVTFDLWHTLLYLSPEAEEEYMEAQVTVASEAMRSAPQRPGAKLRPDHELPVLFERSYSAAVRAAEEGRTISPEAQFRRAADEAGRVADVPGYLRALERVVARLPFARAPGALELLDALKDDGHRIAVISNTVGELGAFLRPVISRMGFDAYVDQYTFSDEQPWAKPAPEIFLATLRAISAEPASSVHVGDGWADVEGAQRAGYRGTILFTGLPDYGMRYRALFAARQGGGPSANFEAGSLPEIGPIIRGLLGGAVGGRG